MLFCATEVCFRRRLFEKQVLTGDLDFREPQRRERAHVCLSIQGRALENPWVLCLTENQEAVGEGYSTAALQCVTCSGYGPVVPHSVRAKVLSLANQQRGPRKTEGNYDSQWGFWDCWPALLHRSVTVSSSAIWGTECQVHHPKATFRKLHKVLIYGL